MSKHTHKESVDDDSDIEEITIIATKPPKDNPTAINSNNANTLPIKRQRSSPHPDNVDLGDSTSTTYTNPYSDLRHAISPTGFDDLPMPACRGGYSRSETLEADEAPDYSPRREEEDSPQEEEPRLTSPTIVGRTTVIVPEPKRRASVTKRIPPQSATACRPVSSALAQAVARRRNSQQSGASGTPNASTTQTRPPPRKPSSIDEPVMWSPQLPSQIEPVREGPQADEYLESYSSPRKAKERVAHKPTIPKNKHKRPLVPAGQAKKVPAPMRTKYLDVIINEYLNTGHPEEQSYEVGLKEEASIAQRAANKSIYLNLIAGLKKRIREKAGLLTKEQQEAEFVNGNRVVSHSEIIIGKVRGTISIEKKLIKSCDPTRLSETELYDKLMRYVMPTDLLDAYNYPSPDPENPEIRKPPLGKDGQKIQLRSELAVSYTCDRCTKVYRVDDTGLPLQTTGKCIYHPGHLWNERINRSLEKRYSCCKGDPSAGGCSSNPYHVHNGQHELENYKGYVDTKAKPHLDPNKHGIFALDCEMCCTTYGLELTRVTVINHKYDVVYERLVKPTRPILDYNTKFSGIKEGDLDDVTMTLADVQRELLEMFSSKSILIGHSLDSDLRALKLYHRRVVDTAQLFPHKRGLPFKRALRTLMQENLHVIIQEDAGHDSKEDASAALRLVMWKIKTDVPEKAK